MPNLAAVKTAFIYGGLPIETKSPMPQKIMLAQKAATESLGSASFSAPRVPTFQLDASRIRTIFLVNPATPIAAIFFSTAPASRLRRQCALDASDGKKSCVTRSNKKKNGNLKK